MASKTTMSFLFLFIALFSCKEENAYDFVLVQTGAVTDIDSSGATFHAKISDLGDENITAYGFVWDSVARPGIGTSEKLQITESPANGLISQRISTAIQTGTEYYVRAFVRQGDFLTYGREVRFTSHGCRDPE